MASTIRKMTKSVKTRADLYKVVPKIRKPLEYRDNFKIRSVRNRRTIRKTVAILIQSCKMFYMMQILFNYFNNSKIS